VDFVSNKAVVDAFRDQFAPYTGYAGNTDWSRPFPGTLFRLPLRTPAQAESSLLSRRALSLPEAMALLQALQGEASAMLLFLKNIESIEIRHWPAGAAEPVRLFACALRDPTQELRLLRSFAGGAGGAAAKSGGVTQADFSLRIRCHAAAAAVADAAGTTATATGATGAMVYEERWEVCNQLGGTQPNAIAHDPANALLRLVPWGGLAACVGTDLVHAEAAAVAPGVRAGLAYCFLPLPVQTGLPVMVNGFFELSSNRRDIWQVSEHAPRPPLLAATPC